MSRVPGRLTTRSHEPVGARTAGPITASVTGITAGMWIAYFVGDGSYDAAVVATALLTILPILPIFSISTNAMGSFVNLA